MMRAFIAIIICLAVVMVSLVTKKDVVVGLLCAAMVFIGDCTDRLLRK